MLHHIAWFNEALVEPRPEGGLTSAHPGVCRRCLLPARELEELGVDCSVFGNMHNPDPVHVIQHLQKLNVDVVVIGELAAPSLLQLARAAKHLGCYVVADFGHGNRTEKDAIELMKIADQAVAACASAAQDVFKQTGAEALVIPDCDESSADLSPKAIAPLWLSCFKQLKMKPPASANTNLPQT